MSKNNYLVTIIFVIVLIISSLLITGCSNNVTELLNTAKYSVNYTVLDESDVPIEGALVSLDGSSKTTDSNGVVTFSITNGTYSYLVSADGYNTYNDTVIVDGANTTVNLNLETQSSPIEQYNITFTVNDIDSNPIEEANIDLDGTTKNTDSNGQVIFIRENGTYNYSVTKTGYVGVNDTNGVNGNVIVNDSNETLNITLYIAPPVGYKGIYSWSDLYSVRYNMTAQDKYILMNNLDNTSNYYDQFASINANSGKGWQPIGTFSNRFKGIFDGNNYVISDLYINRPSEDYVGLFGHMENGSINNLGLESINITGGRFTGALTGILIGINDSIVENCYSTGNINGTDYIGGLIGQNSSNTVTGCYSMADVTGDNIIGGLVGVNSEGATLFESYASGSVRGLIKVGGLVGDNSNSTIEKCYAGGDVIGDDDYIGGLVGYSAKGKIDKSFATGNVSGSDFLGGLAGYFGTDYIVESHVKNSYALGSVTGIYSETTYGYYVGGLIGRLIRSNIENSYSVGLVDGQNYVGGLIGENPYSDGNVTNSYYDSETAGLSDTGKGFPRTTEQMQKGTADSTINAASMYTGWDNLIWNFGSDTDYPALSWE